MSGTTIAPYFPFRRIKIINQEVDTSAHKALIHMLPDQRFQPICQMKMLIQDISFICRSRTTSPINIAIVAIGARISFDV